jgi:hypothetical protein
VCPRRAFHGLHQVLVACIAIALVGALLSLVLMSTRGLRHRDTSPAAARPDAPLGPKGAA